MELTHYQLHNPQKSIEVAAILQKFVQEKKLTANIQGKQYPLVEAWQFAGSQLGLYPICTELKDISTPDEIKYFAKVEVRRFEDDKLVSNGFAICSNKEYSKRKFDEYAIASMAQTRATGKSFRNLLAWLMKAAGFEATPAEEMDFATNVVTQDVTHEVPTKEELDLLRKLTYSARFDTEANRSKAFDMIANCNNYYEYQRIQHRLEDLQPSIDEIPNPSQTDIKNHVKKLA